MAVAGLALRSLNDFTAQLPLHADMFGLYDTGSDEIWRI